MERKGRGILGVETAWAKDLAIEMYLAFSGTVRGQTCTECLPGARHQAGPWGSAHGLHPYLNQAQPRL